MGLTGCLNPTCGRRGWSRFGGRLAIAMARGWTAVSQRLSALLDRLAIAMAREMDAKGRMAMVWEANAHESRLMVQAWG